MPEHFITQPHALKHPKEGREQPSFLSGKPWRCSGLHRYNPQRISNSADNTATIIRISPTSILPQFLYYGILVLLPKDGGADDG